MLGLGPPRPKGLEGLRQLRLPLGQRRQLPMPQRQLLQTLVPVKEWQGRLPVCMVEWECKGWCRRRMVEGRIAVAMRARKLTRLPEEVEPGGEMCLKL